MDKIEKPRKSPMIPPASPIKDMASYRKTSLNVLIWGALMCPMTSTDPFVSLIDFKYLVDPSIGKERSR